MTGPTLFARMLARYAGKDLAKMPGLAVELSPLWAPPAPRTVGRPRNGWAALAVPSGAYDVERARGARKGAARAAAAERLGIYFDKVAKAGEPKVTLPRLLRETAPGLSPHDAERLGRNLYKFILADLRTVERKMKAEAKAADDRRRDERHYVPQSISA